MQSINASVTADTIDVYWELPADAVAGELYTVLLDGSTIGESTRTYYTLAELTPGQNHTVTVRRGGQLLGQISVTAMTPRRRIDVTAAPYEAVGDGTTLNTTALQRAIDDCGAEDEVYLPAGIYRTGALDLHSNLSILLDEGAVLQGSEDPADYLPKIPSRFEGTEQLCYRSLLNAGQLDHTLGPNCHNILLHGSGTISGGGKTLALRMMELEREALRDYLAANAELVATCENERTIPGRVRGRLINLSNCAHVRITGLTLQNGPSWNVHMIYSNEIVTDHCRIISSGIWNGDGWDPDSSTDCTLYAVEFQTADDCVAIKSGKNPEGNVIARPTRGIRIFGCHSERGNGIALGSEMSGGIEDVRVWDCDFANAFSGIEIKGTPKRGGYVRGVSVRDCTFPRLVIHSVPYNDDGIAAPETPVFEDFYLERVRLTGTRLEGDDLSYISEKRPPVTTVAVASFYPIDVEGFAAQDDRAGRDIRNIVIKDCILPVNAQIHLSRCSEVSMENIQTESSK